MTVPRVASVVRAPRFGEDWWRRGVIYQIYPRSFADSDGDGVGDFEGILEHLDHLGPAGLGVDAIWLSPIYPSPGLDVGYDVSDHEHVDPLFGSEADFDRLVEAAHELGIRVILDLVMNHTSDEHPWFRASRASRQGPFADWYLWRDPSGIGPDGPEPPNNWVSWFGGPAWTFDPQRGQFYHHTFLAEQPELNWRAGGVEAAQFAMVRGWLARGVDGFRLDVFNAFLKDPGLGSNPVREGTTAWDRLEHINDMDQPDLPELIGRFRALVAADPDRMSVGELFIGSTERAASLTEDRHLVFDWELINQPWDASAFRLAIERRELAFGSDRWPTVVLSNHDQPRHASRLAESVGATGLDRDAIAKAAAVIALTLRGTPFLYYGEELGLGNVEIPPGESVDPPAARVGPDFVWWDRSQARTPMPWRPEPGAGFTSGRPWLRLAPDVQDRNVSNQSQDPHSVLALYRRGIKSRASLAALNSGTLRLLPARHEDVLSYERLATDGSAARVFVNFGSDAAAVETGPDNELERWLPAFGTHLDPARPDQTGRLQLRPREGVVLSR